MSHAVSTARWVLFILCLVAWVGASSASLGAGSQRNAPATITGQVVDETGGVVPGVSIQVRQAETGREQTVFTDASGRFTVDQLLAGSYSITASVSGFETLVNESVEVAPGQNVDVESRAQGFEPARLRDGPRHRVLEVQGQAFSWAKDGTRTIFTIDRRKLLVRTIEIPPVIPADPKTSVPFR